MEAQLTAKCERKIRHPSWVAIVIFVVAITFVVYYFIQAWKRRRIKVKEDEEKAIRHES